MGGLVVLHLAAVTKVVWISHLVAIGLAGVLAWAFCHLGSRADQYKAALAISLLTIASLTIPLTCCHPGPSRWASIGPLKLYLAPMLLPSFIAACSFLVRQPERRWIAALIAILVVALLLGLQPDASQVLALLIAAGVLAIRYQLGAARSGLLLLPLAVLAAWAFSVPDPLQPVPHVEEVFKLALSHSFLAGIAVITSALALIVGLWIQSRVGPAWLSAVAAYYAVLFACSAAGLTPAPLIGYGAGPILGFGLMVGLLPWFEIRSAPSTPQQPTANSSSE